MSVPTVQQDLESLLATTPHRVLVIAGAGVSMATAPGPCATWSGLLAHGIDWCRNRLALPPQWFTAVGALLSLNDFVGAASMIVKALKETQEGEYARWLGESVGRLRPTNRSVIEALARWGVQIATTNYDGLFEEITGRLAITWRNKNQVAQFLEGDPSGILHLHGYVLDSDSIVLDAKSYEDVCRDRMIRDTLRMLLTFKKVVYVGCGAGLSDPNFGALLRWSRRALERFQTPHFRLVRAAEVPEVTLECNGLNVRPLSYGEDYPDLFPFLEAIATAAAAKREPNSILETLAREQGGYGEGRRDLEAAKESLSAGEYSARTTDLASRLWISGGHQTAALAMERVFHQEADRLPTVEKIRLGLDAASMLLEDDNASNAAEILRRLQPEVEKTEVPPDLVASYRAMHVRCLNDLCAYAETIEEIRKAMSIARGDDLERLRAQRAEIQLLQGELDEAVRLLDEEVT